MKPKQECAAEDLTTIRQWNALASWVAAKQPTDAIIAFVDDEHSCEIINGEYSEILCVVHECANAAYRRPSLDCLMNRAIEIAETELLALVNGDIVLFEDFAWAVKQIFYAKNSTLRPMVVGQRTDIVVTTFLDVGKPGWRDLLIRKIKTRGILHLDWGLDYFVFRKDTLRLLPIPAFLIGAWRWDNWLLSECVIRTDIDVVDATNLILAVHQSVSPEQRQRVGAEFNHNLVARLVGERWRLGRTSNADFVAEGVPMESCRVVPNMRPRLSVFAYKHAAQMASSNWMLALLPVPVRLLPLTDTWIEWARRIAFRSFVFLAEDLAAYKHLRDRGMENVIFSPYAPRRLAQASRAREALSPEPLEFRAELLTKLRNNGIDVLISDVEHFWLEHPTYELALNCGNYRNQWLMSAAHRPSNLLIGIRVPRLRQYFWYALAPCRPLADADRVLLSNSTDGSMATSGSVCGQNRLKEALRHIEPGSINSTVLTFPATSSLLARLEAIFTRTATACADDFGDPS